jgi:hypothetical protein
LYATRTLHRAMTRSLDLTVAGTRLQFCSADGLRVAPIGF